MTTSKWAADCLACPRCGGALRGLGTRGATVTRCDDCGPYPVLAGVPVLVPEPARWCASFYDAALAALAEVGRASHVEVKTLRAFADAAPGVEAQRFSDDWTAWEAAGAKPPALTDGPGSDALTELIRVATEQAPSLWLEHRTPQGTVLEVGCGAGATSTRLMKERRSVLVGDLSLRAVLFASQRSGAVPVVLDAQALPVRPRSLDAVVAENVVDLLEAPEAFFTSAKLALDVDGALLLSSPAPALGRPDDDEETLTRLAKGAGFSVDEVADGLPWLRRNSGRFLEVWLVQAVSLVHAKGRRRR